MNYIHDNFLLNNQTAIRLYHEFTQQLPVVDFHNHLSPGELLTGRRFFNLSELWLEHDHYKWRAMRAAGHCEQLVTGDACPLEKFRAWAATVPKLIGNSLYEWTHLELARFFGIFELLSSETADHIWRATESQMASVPFSTETVLQNCNVHFACTTDDPVDSLAAHRAWAERNGNCRLLPTFRPDQVLAIEEPVSWHSWLAKLGSATGHGPIESYAGLLSALRQRHSDFHDLGCRLSDHGLPQMPSERAEDAAGARVFDQARNRQTISREEAGVFRASVLQELASCDLDRGWTKQIHLGALRNNCSRLWRDFGRDAGADSIGDWTQVERLRQFLDLLDQQSHLPHLIIYVLNPADAFPVATMLGNFAKADRHLSLGAAWWFLDHRDGIRMILDVVAACGLLPQFPGMVTDSRSILSLCRHDWFRRIFCDWLGEKVEKGQIPPSETMLCELVQRVCHTNAIQIFERDRNVQHVGTGG